MAVMAAIALPLGRYQACFAFDTPPRFSNFPGSAWRGALGYALKRTVCATNQPRCSDCLLYRSCLYPYFYDTPPAPNATKMRRYSTVPHPYILHPEGVVEAETYRLGFTLIGKVNQHLPVFLYALMQAAQSQRGVAGNRFQLSGIQQEVHPGDGDWQSIYQPGGTLTAFPPERPRIPPPPETCTIEIHTPLRIKRDGHHVDGRQFAFADLFGNLLRRVSMLCVHHSDTSLEVDFQGLMVQARHMDCEVDLHWQDLVRYSARQKATMRLGGVMGQIRISEQDLSPFWPYLWLGQWLHGGSGATMGLGRYTIAASLPGRCRD